MFTSITPCWQVSEAIQIGARVMKEHEVSWEELQHSMQELEDSIDLHKQVASAIGTSIMDFFPVSCLELFFHYNWMRFWVS